MTLKLHFKLLLFLLLASYASYSQNDIWKKSGAIAQDQLTKYHLQQDKISYFEFNQTSFLESLISTPLRSSSNKTSTTKIELPGFNGKMEVFYIYETPTFSKELAVKFPDIKSYSGYSINDPTVHLKMSVSPKGVQTMITYVNKPTVFMQPIEHGSNKYVVYDQSSKTAFEDPFECKTIDDIHKNYDNKNSNDTNRDADDQTLRKFRLAMSVNGEYTTYHGGTTAGALAGINATLTRINAVFETDMAVTFELVDATELIYINAATDPYSDSLDNWNSELQTTLNNTIGNNAYDIGHMFGASGGGGSAGCIGCVCVDNQKGSGKTSPADGIPEGDNFDIDYVAHEIGHQMGANHTFSHTTEGTGVNSEPGSGTTIMGYAGITGANNVQLHSDAYFHYHSINQILNNLDFKTCWTGIPISNNSPVADAGSDFIIPIGTAYVLKGAATDADGGDALTYCWEQTDSGPVTNLTFGPTLTAGSNNRSLPPTGSPDRYIPNLSRVIENRLIQNFPTITSEWETVSNVGRTQNWALTVRDRDASATGLNGQSSFDLMQIVVDANSGPFAVTSQTTNESWDVGSTQVITWDVAGTNSGSVNAATVDIKLSIDGGLTYPYTMAANVPNDGLQAVTVPVVDRNTVMARVLIEANGNIFYALNSTNFSVQEAEFALTMTNISDAICQPTDAVYNYVYNTYSGFTDNTIFSTSGLPAGLTATFVPTSASADDTPVTVTISGTSSVTPNEYLFDIIGTSGSIIKETEVTLNVYSSTIDPLTLTVPLDSAVNVVANSNLIWNIDTNAQSYEIEIATDNGFSSIIESTTVASNNYSPSTLANNTEYFWHVKPKNLCADGVFSSTFSFTTQNISCQSIDATDTPIDIPDNNSVGITSIINIDNIDALVINDINVTLNVTHPWIGDLAVTLTSPDGTVVTLVISRNDPGQNYTNTVFDDQALNPLNSGSAPYTGDFKPQELLSAFNGEYSNGNWTLKIVDSGPEDIGSLVDWNLEVCGGPIPDSDGDGVADNLDNCVLVANADQADFDNDGQGDVCDNDIDNDGVLNGNDLCDDTPDGDSVDVTGCSVFSLPINNFTLQIISETCRNSDNGTINITAVATFDYTAQLTGNGLDISNDFTANTEFINLQAGSYTVCITVDGQPNYEQCYNITIEEPEDLAVLSRINSITGRLTLELSGGTSYNITLNGVTTSTTESEITLVLSSGVNQLKVTTDKECQGTYRETITNRNNILLTPNPLGEEELNILINDSTIERIQVSVYSLIGKAVFSSHINTIDGTARINLSKLSSGVYIVNIDTGNTNTNHKIIKK